MQRTVVVSNKRSIPEVQVTWSISLTKLNRVSCVLDDCSLGRTEVERLYDPGLRQWVVDNGALARLSTLRTIVDCTEEGDTILLNTTQRINVTQTIVLSKSLTISAYVEDTQLLDNVFPRAENKVAFSCPRNESLFRTM